MVVNGRRRPLDIVSAAEGPNAAIVGQDGANEGFPAGLERGVRLRLPARARDAGNRRPVEVRQPLMGHLVVRVLIAGESASRISLDALEDAVAAILRRLIERTDVEACHGVSNVAMKRAELSDRRGR